MFDVGWNLLIFSVKKKIEKMSKIILKQRRLIRSLPILWQMEVQKERLDRQAKIYFILLYFLIYN
jgi:hypothetical protein